MSVITESEIRQMRILRGPWVDQTKLKGAKLAAFRRVMASLQAKDLIESHGIQQWRLTDSGHAVLRGMTL